MRIIINLVEIIALFYVAYYSVAYYTGWLNLSSEKDARRVQVLKSWGWLLLICAIVLFMGGLYIIFETYFLLVSK